MEGEGAIYQKGYVKEIIETSGHPITVYRCPQYVPGNPSGKKILLQEFSFTCTSLIRLMGVLGKKKYDYVLTMVEAMAYGKLVFTFRRTKGISQGMKYSYIIQGENGNLFESMEKLMPAINNIDDNQIVQMWKNARSFVEENLSVEKMANYTIKGF